MVRLRCRFSLRRFLPGAGPSQIIVGMSPTPFQIFAAAILALAAIANCPAAAAQQPAEGVRKSKRGNPPLTVEDFTQKNDSVPIAPEKKPASKPSAAATGVTRLVGPDGKGVVLPKNATLQGYLDWLQQPPDYAVCSVALEGTANDRRAELTATIIVQLRNERQWVRIPVYLNERQFVATKHTYLGSSLDPPRGKHRNEKSNAAALFGDYRRDVGYRWWFRGKGYHRLTISLVVPVEKTVAQRRLRLKLPPLAAASTLSLRVNDANLVPQKPDNADVTRVGKKASQVRVTGLGSELDLQWRTVASSRGRAPMLQAQTSVVVDFTDDSIKLTALQRIRSYGSVSRVVVQLPAGFQAEATGKFVKACQIDARNRATVDFTDQRPELTEINWTLRRGFPSAGGNLTLDGFQVEGAKMQSGDVAIVKVQGWRVKRSDENNVAVNRIRADAFLVPDLIRDKPLSGLYRFTTQPFRLNLRVSRVQPHLAVDPAIRLNVSNGKIVLNAVFQVEVSEDGGTVRDLEIRWPGWRAAGWKFSPLTATSLIEHRTLDAPIRLRLAGWRGGTFEVPLSAERTIAPSKNGVEIRLPVLTAAASRQTTSRPTTLVVVREPNLTLDLTDRDEQPLPEIATDGDGGDPLTQRYRVADAATAQLTARIKTHPQSLRATTAVDLDPKLFGLYARQTISLHVDYVPVSTVRFEVPEKGAGRVEFYDANRRRLPTQPATSKTGKPLLEVRLERPRLGKIAFVAVVFRELPKPLRAGESTSLAVPLVRVEGVDFSQVRVQAPADSNMEIALSGGKWQRIPTYDSSPAWSGDTASTSFDVQMTSPAVPRSRPFTISRALVRASIDSAGTVTYRAQYQVSGKADAVVVALPAGARLDSVFWGTQRVAGLRRKDATRAGGTMRIPAPSDSEAAGRRLLTIDYHTNGQPTSHWMPSHNLVAPRFPGNVWIEETAWQVMMPRDQHLSSFGASYSPEFSWNRTPVLWSRQPTAEFADPEAWIHASDGPPWSVTVEGNSYVFRRYGPAEDLAIQSMSRPLIVLAGAGLAWLIGILLVKLPRLRTLAVLLTAALAAAVTGLWFATELLLLLQPALLGAVLALGIVGIDRVIRRRTAPTVMAVAHPSEFVTGSRSSATVRPSPVPMPGSEDPTSVRQPVSPLVSGIAGAEPSSTASEARRQG